MIKFISKLMQSSDEKECMAYFRDYTKLGESIYEIRYKYIDNITNPSKSDYCSALLSQIRLDELTMEDISLVLNEKLKSMGDTSIETLNKILNYSNCMIPWCEYIGDRFKLINYVDKSDNIPEVTQEDIFKFCSLFRRSKVNCVLHKVDYTYKNLVSQLHYCGIYPELTCFYSDSDRYHLLDLVEEYGNYPHTFSKELKHGLGQTMNYHNTWR